MYGPAASSKTMSYFRNLEPTKSQHAVPVVSVLTGDLEVIAIQIHQAKSEKARRNLIAKFHEVNARRLRIAEHFDLQGLAREVII